MIITKLWSKILNYITDVFKSTMITWFNHILKTYIIDYFWHTSILQLISNIKILMNCQIDIQLYYIQPSIIYYAILIASIFHFNHYYTNPSITMNSHQIYWLLILFFVQQLWFDIIYNLLWNSGFSIWDLPDFPTHTYPCYLNHRIIINQKSSATRKFKFQINKRVTYHDTLNDICFVCMLDIAFDIRRLSLENEDIQISCRRQRFNNIRYANVVRYLRMTLHRWCNNRKHN